MLPAILLPIIVITFVFSLPFLIIFHKFDFIAAEISGCIFLLIAIELFYYSVKWGFIDKWGIFGFLIPLILICSVIIYFVDRFYFKKQREQKKK